MNPLKRILIYPYTKDFYPILKALIKTTEYNDFRIVSPRACSIERDAGYIVNREDMGIVVSNNFYDSVNGCDTLLVPDISNIELFHEDIIEKIEYAIENNLNIECYAAIDKILAKKLNEKAQSSGKIFDFYENQKMYNENTPIIKKNLVSFNIPIVFVGDLYDKSDSMEITIQLCEKLKLSGYKAIATTLGINCNILGSSYTNWPIDFFQSNITESDKVYMLNDFIGNMIDEKKPDIILLQLPPGLIRFNNEYVNNFGIYPYLISQAIQPDYFILSTQYELIEAEYYDKLSINFYHKFGINIDILVVSNIYFDVATADRQGGTSHFYLDINRVCHEVKDFHEHTKKDIKIFPINEFDEIYNEFINLFA